MTGGDERRRGDLGSSIRGRWRMALTTVLTLVAGLVAITQLLVMLRAWQLAGDELAQQGPAPERTRLTVMAEALSYLAFQVGSLDVAVGAVAAVAAFALVARSAASARTHWRHMAWAVTLAVVVLGLATVVLHVLVQVNWLIVTGDSTVTVFLPPDPMLGLARLFSAAADGLLWAAALIVGLHWRPGARRFAWLDDEDEHDADDAHHRVLDIGDGEHNADSAEVDVAHHGRPVTPAASPPDAYAGPVIPDPAPSPRLEADGSSDSGYDEFRFRR